MSEENRVRLLEFTIGRFFEFLEGTDLTVTRATVRGKNTYRLKQACIRDKRVCIDEKIANGKD